MKWMLGVLLFLVSGCETPTKELPLSLSDWKAAVVVSDFTTGRLVPFSGPGGVPTHGDAIVRRRLDGGWLVVNRLGGDNLQWVSGDWKIENQVSVGRGTNPQDAVAWGGGHWVSHLRRSDLVQWGPNGEELATIDLCAAGHCDADGYGEPTYFHRYGDRLFVLLQRLDIPGGYVPAGGSRLLELDGNEAKVLESNLLLYQNPVTEFKVIDEQVLVGSVGFRNTLDGGIERWNLETGEGTAVVDEKALGGDLVDFAPLTPSRGVAIVAKGNHTFLVHYGPDGVQGFDPPFDRADGFHWLKVLAKDQHIFLLDRNPVRPGIHEIVEDRLIQFQPMELPPYWMEFE